MLISSASFQLPNKFTLPVHAQKMQADQDLKYELPKQVTSHNTPVQETCAITIAMKPEPVNL